MIEDVERIDAQLEGEAFENLRVLLAGEIDVTETRAKDHSTRHVAETVGGVLEAAVGRKQRGRADTGLNERHIGCVRPLYLLRQNRANQVGADHTGDAGEGGGVGEGDRIAGLKLNDGRQTETFEQPIAFEWQSID